jgi:RNA polymerase sigma factor (sigma-70 family)
MFCPVLGGCGHNNSEMNDWRLLREYLDHGSESAFNDLVHRHVDMVYSVAIRKLGQPQAAQEVVQSVFCLLAEKAKSFEPSVLLSSWLYQAACYKGAELLRTEQRRRAREQEALSMEQLNAPAENEPIWKEMAPLLDDAMQQLRETDRQAILLRFFERKPLREVGLAFRLDEDAARKRVERAVEKLRILLAKRGVTSTASGLTAALVAGAVVTAPNGLAASVVSGALATLSLAAATATTSTTLSILKLMSITKIVKTAAVIALIIGGVAVLVHQTTRRPPRTPEPGQGLLAGPEARPALPDGAALLSALASNDAVLAAGGVTIEGTEVRLPGKIRFPVPENRRVGPAARYKWKFTYLSTNRIAYDHEAVELLRWEDWLPPGSSLPQPGDQPAWMYGRTLSFISPELTGFFNLMGPLKPGIWSAPQALLREGVSGAINLYRSNPLTLSDYLEVPLWLVGRGYARHLESISSIEPLAGGRLAVNAKGKVFYSRATKWELVVEPAAGYLVRSATYYVDDSDRTLTKPRYVITTSGLLRFGSLALPEKFEQRDPLSVQDQPFHRSGTVTSASLKGDPAFLDETAAMFQAPFPVSTEVADNRSNPPVHLNFSAGATLDRNALRQLQAREPKPGARPDEEKPQRPKER